MRSRKPKISIHLNRNVPEEDYGGCRVETRDAPTKKKIKKLQAIIEELNHENKALELWKDKQQDKVEKMKGKNKEQPKFSNKIKNMNIKIYWGNLVLKTKLLAGKMPL